ncbi:MAG: hypothetical protein ACREOM_11010, partial [Candidatus Dormibacteraceae bacterium]
MLCHLREQLGGKRELFVESEMLEHARRLPVRDLRLLCRYARHAADPDGFARDAEEVCYHHHGWSMRAAGRWSGPGASFGSF